MVGIILQALFLEQLRTLIFSMSVVVALVFG
jgi:hypothetical protein